MMLDAKVEEIIRVARAARRTGRDVSEDVEIKKANSLPDRVSALFENEEIGKRISFWLEKGMDKYTTAFKVAGEIASSMMGKNINETAELAVRVGLAIITDAVVSAPVEGISKVVVKRTKDRSYLSIYYNGPIRTAGGTEGALSVLIADYVRQKLGLQEFKPGDNIIARYIEEVELYRRHAHLQYNATSEEIRRVVENLPVEVTGPPTEEEEVSSNRDIPSIETNRIRGGAVLVINDCLAQKAKKLAKLIDDIANKLGDFDTSSWNWLHLVGKKEGKSEKSNDAAVIVPSMKFMEDAVVGRPILSYPSKPGGFRLRYGHARNTGLASVGINPATMVILDEFLAIGTQVRIERPGKSAVVMPVDSIEGPVVRLRDGSVVRVDGVEEARKIADKVERILFLGDVLIGFGEFLENNHKLIPSPWVEEWWAEMLRAKGVKVDPWAYYSFDEAIKLSIKYDVPIHPRWTYFWHDITLDELSSLIEAVRKAESSNGRLILEVVKEIKEILEKLCIPHKLEDGKIVIEGDDAKALLASLSGMDKFEKSKYESTMDAINDIAAFRIMQKATYYVGMRVGRPEKAKQRKMKPPVNLLFPVGNLKGRSRMVSRANGAVTVEVALRRCESCGRTTTRYFCCGSRTKPLLFCSKCGREVREKCPQHPDADVVRYRQIMLDIRELIKEAFESLGQGYDISGLKGVIGLTSRDKTPEPLEKGILRAKYGLSVFKDGTIRFDSTNTVLTHFKPREIGTSVEKLRELGYTHDIYGKELTSDDQLLELKVQDIILPKEAGDHFLRVAGFIDELLEKFYGLEPYYNAKKPEDLIGHIFLTISPHTFVANAVRLIGFTDASVVMAHPFIHAAKRRNADGDEDSIILGLDALLNFSRSYLPNKPGGREDAPLLLVTQIDLEYVDDETYNIETVDRYPLEFFEATWRYEDPSNVKIRTVGSDFKKGEVKMSFTVPVRSLEAPRICRYRKLNTMAEKLEAHVALEAKIRAVDLEDSLSRALSHHFIRDIAGNLRKFSQQQFRCMRCNAKYRRVPLSGRCEKCGGELNLTVHRGTAIKYLIPTAEIINKYGIKGYLEHRVMLLQEEADQMFSRGNQSKLELLEEEKPRKFGLSSFL
ncbi:MAG: DNA polymerase II large subunit [Candidatus Methanodesulfokora sp.]